MANPLKTVIGFGNRSMVQIFTSSGTFQVPFSSGLLTCYICGCGGGGGGGRSSTAGGGGGGGGGAESVRFFPVIVDMSLGDITVTIGPAGTGQAGASGAGGDGGATTFGATLSLAGGKGGLGGAASGGGAATVAGGNGSNNIYAGSSSTSVVGSSPTQGPVWTISSFGGLVLPYWLQDGSGGGCGNSSGNVGGDSGDAQYRELDDSLTVRTSGAPATAYEGGSGGSCCFGNGGKREGATGTTNVVVPQYGGGGSGGVNGVIAGQDGGPGYLEVWYYL